MINKKKRAAHVVDFAVLVDHKVKVKVGKISISCKRTEKAEDLNGDTN